MGLRKLLEKKRNGYVKIVLINLIIILSIWIMLSTNFKIHLPQILPSVYPSSNSDHIISRTNWRILYADWTLDQLAYGTGLKNYWRMFAPVDNFNWHMKFVAIRENGEKELLPLANQIKRNFWERNFIDFREAKFHLNIYKKEHGQRNYAQYDNLVF